MNVYTPKVMAILHEAKRWGVPVTFASKSHFMGTFWSNEQSDMIRPSPVDGLIHWFSKDKTGIVVFPIDIEWDNESYSALLHEILHVAVGEDPDNINELDLLLALEHEAHKRLKLDFEQWMKDFELGNKSKMDTWDYLSPSEKHELISKSRAYAERRGLMKNGRPTYVQGGDR